MKTLLVVVLALSLSSCAMHEFKQGDPLVALEMSKESSKIACYQSQAMNGPDYTKLGDMAIMAIEQQKAMIQIVGAITGKNLDPCGGGTNLNDVLISDSRERNQSLRALGGEAFGAVKVVGGILAVGTVLDKVGQNSGSTTTGDNSPISKTVSESNTDTTAVNAGEGTATTGGTASDPGIVDTTPVDTTPVDPTIPTL